MMEDGIETLRQLEGWLRRSRHTLVADGLIAVIAEIEKLTERNEYLEERDSLLCALESAGVDNWSGYDQALELLDEWNDEEDDEEEGGD